MFGFGKKKAIEKHMAEWLEHPNEFGVKPKSVKFKKTYKGRLLGLGDTEIHLVDYTMPDGRTGRGFVNGSLTWSFLGDEVNSIDDNNLIKAYCGWAWLFPSLQQGNVATRFDGEAEQARLAASLESQGVQELQFRDKYKIGDSELFEFFGTLNGEKIRGAGDSGHQTMFRQSQTQFALPTIYFHLGDEVIQSLN